ncbi:MAG TPA: hypothetical protein DEB05_12415 [Firmicutes bacterium]|nr:hypothetical protein [Bacillota bacterium]
MHLKLIACEVFTREVCYCIANSPHTIDPEFTKIGSHTNSDKLRAIIQEKIDEANKGQRKYDALVLAYGLCGNATVGLYSRNLKIIIPRVHDCGGLLLESGLRFKEHFGENPSQPFWSSGHLERSKDGEVSEVTSWFNQTFTEYVRLYGEDNAKYLIESLKLAVPEERMVYIEIPETKRADNAVKSRIMARKEKKKYYKMEGSIRLIRDLTHGVWDKKYFLIMEPNQKTVGIYDWNEVIAAEEVI